MSEALKSRPVPDARLHRGFNDLARVQSRGTDYEIRVERRAGSAVAIIAPHGGGIEDGTSEIARAIAGNEFNLYLFEGIRLSRNYAALHLTSSRFDEPECLALISECRYVIAVHGCGGKGERVLLGGLDGMLKNRIGVAIADSGLVAEGSGHRYPAVHPRNICNRGKSGRGVQLELTYELRRSGSADLVCQSVRAVLLNLGNQLMGPSSIIVAPPAALNPNPERK
jgi:phage replication-related protein YjqB (UPF0714/DUF867 family)